MSRPIKDTGQKVLVWFSCGAASAVAAKLALAKYGHERVEIVYTDPGSEHPDNVRFRADCEVWFGRPILVLKNPKYKDTWDLWEKRKRVISAQGFAPCTTELKKQMRHKHEDLTELQVFGYTAEEVSRANGFRKRNPEVMLVTPLIEAGLTKADTIALIERAGIRVPAMYLMGYQNNNCIGCPKGGMGYWNKIRRDFPDVFERMAKLERQHDFHILRNGDEELWLDTLDPSRGNHSDEPSFECSLLCHIAEQDMEPTK